MNPSAEQKKKFGALLVLCTILFCIVSAGAFFSYRGLIEREFNHLVSDNLAAYTLSQKKEVEQYISALQSTVNDTATLLSGVDWPPEGAQATQYLAQVKAHHKQYQIAYHAMEVLRQMPEAAAVVAQLQAGMGAISDISGAESTTGKYFRIAAPVMRNDTVIGAVCGTISADTLVRTSQTGYLRREINGQIIRDNGDVLPLRSGQTDGVNLFRENARKNASAHSDKVLRDMLANGGSSADSFVGRNGKRVFVFSADLGYHGWNLVNFASADDVIGYSRNILRYTTVICIALLLCTALLWLVVFWVGNRQRQQLRLSEMRYDLLSRFSDTTLYAYDYRTDEMDWSANAQQLLAINATHMAHYTRDARECDYVHPDDWETVRAAHRNQLPEGTMGSFEVRVLGADGAYHWCSCQYQTLYDKHMTAMLVGKVTDISAHKEREQHLQQQAAADSLTELLNAVAFRKQVQALGEQGEDGFFFMIDVDNFKSINDTFGHTAGDMALRGMAAALRKTFRADDPIGRLGGDEFAAFMVGVRDQEVATAKVRLLLRAVTEISVPETPALRISISVGIAAMCGGNPCARSLYDAADEAMYAAKHEGKNTFRMSPLPPENTGRFS